jgi:VCBS repeat-containing protein
LDGPIAVNSPPVAVDFTQTLTTTSIAIDVLDHVTDADGDPITVTKVTQGQYGTTTINSDGTVTYTLQQFAIGTDSFSFTVSDGHGGTATATVTLQLQVPLADGFAMLQSQVVALSPSPSLPSKLTEANISWLRAGTEFSHKLKAFTNEIRAMTKGGRLLASVGQEWIDEATAMMEEVPSR